MNKQLYQMKINRSGASLLTISCYRLRNFWCVEAKDTTDRSLLTLNAASVPRSVLPALDGNNNHGTVFRLKLPVVVRMEGTNVELGRQMLAESGLALTNADDMGDGAKKAVALARR